MTECLAQTLTQPGARYDVVGAPASTSGTAWAGQVLAFAVRLLRHGIAEDPSASTAQQALELARSYPTTLEGLWADLDFDVTEQDIEEVRREMWPTAAGDAGT